MPPPDQTILREITADMAELEKDFARRMDALRRKLRVALGDVKQRPPVVEFVSKDGETHPIRGGKGR